MNSDENLEIVGGTGTSANAKVDRVSNSRCGLQPVRKITIAFAKDSQLTVSSPGLNMSRFIELLESIAKLAKRQSKQGLELDTFSRVLRDRAKLNSTA